jgi:GrpB-like predicted nucleotidyltransferase (UPF0157 family)
MGKVYFQPSEKFTSKANKIFQEQKLRINKLIPEADIQHIGSTSIPGSLTKGDLDVVVRVPAERFNETVEYLKRIYQINQPENWTENFASFKDEENLGIDFGAQLVIKDSKEDDFIRLRDKLMVNPNLPEQYNQMKQKNEGKDMNEYRKEKADFFEKLRKT